ncbi:hypothetical protein [Xanthobacter autotrophicus]|uniref:hypothetical protein n=1 Tax=Xanthobacter autotrophicus TaxID=280 RepID=UPI003727756B
MASHFDRRAVVPATFTEALDAGAVPHDVMNAAGHTQLSTTQGYDRGMLQKTARVAQLRIASRKNEG